jgi:hypothetical protein
VQPAKTAPQQTSASETMLDLDLVDVDLYEALATVAGKASINIFADSDLDQAGRVTISVRSVPWKDALATIAADHQLRVEQLDVRGSDHASLWVSRQSSASAPVTKFTRTLGDFATTHFAVDDDVQANITLHLRLPWDLALYHLAQKYNLRIVRSESVIRITRR